MNWYKVIRHDNTVIKPYIADKGDLMGVDEEDLWGGYTSSS